MWRRRPLPPTPPAPSACRRAAWCLPAGIPRATRSRPCGRRASQWSARRFRWACASSTPRRSSTARNTARRRGTRRSAPPTTGWPSTCRTGAACTRSACGPGGTVVAAASEEGGVCTNGMSRFARDGENANSALLVEVRPDDLSGDDVLAGGALQRRMERAAYRAAQAAGGAPYCGARPDSGDFLAAGGSGAAARAGAGAGCGGGGAALAEGPRAARAGGARAHDAGAGAPSVRPSYPRGVTWCDLRGMPAGVRVVCHGRGAAPARRQAARVRRPARRHDRRETRSSSPVRIVRGADFQATMDGRAPAAEPARGEAACILAARARGYAGGIMSAAVDGLRVAEAIVGEVVRRA